MATLLFSAIGASVGNSLLGGVVGSALGAALGRGAGALLGQRVDELLFGSGMGEQQSDPRERLKFTNLYVGQSVPQIFGRSRLAGQVIWAKKISAEANGEGGYKYSSSFAIAICEGDVHRVGRIWANNQTVALDRTSYRFYSGSESQLPDPLIELDLGAGQTPAFRGICYLVFENIDLAQFGNSIPNFEFEVFRHARSKSKSEIKDNITAVSIIPGTGEYALESKKVEVLKGFGEGIVVNANREGDQTDFDHAIEQLKTDVPNVKSTSLVVSWFGDDLRCAECQIMPKVEQNDFDGLLPWTSNGMDRQSANSVSRLDENSVYGGTPSDASVVNAIRKLKQSNLAVMFYPFILMDIPEDNTLQNPWENGKNQPVNPWRGRITTSVAPGLNGSIDQTSQARAEIDSFFGKTHITNFAINGDTVTYTGNTVEKFH